MRSDIDRRETSIPESVMGMVRELGSACCSMFGLLTGAQTGQPDSPASKLEIQAEIWKLRRLLRTALGDGVEQDVIGAIGWFAANGPRLERAAVVWVDLIETLVQAEERTYGARPGLGSLKKAQVKEVLWRLLARERLRVPAVPEILEPMVLELFVDWVVDVLVLMCNRHSMWTADGDVALSSAGVYWAALRKRLSGLLQFLVVGLTWLVRRLEMLFHSSVVLPPGILSALNRVEREGFLVNTREALNVMESLVVWISKHRGQLVAAFELIFAAVNDAEAYVELSGPEKREYACNLVFAVLEDLGLDERAGLMFAVLNSLIGSGIESTVHLFNKRQVFVHRAASNG